MSRGADWTAAEVEATVADYFSMLTAELRGERVNKAEHRRALLQRLDGRTEAAVEFKHQNISAVLAAMDHPHIQGYKRASNWQTLLAETVARRLPREAELARLVALAANAPVETSPTGDILARLDTAPPQRSGRAESVREGRAAPLLVPRARVNWLERESRNRSLGDAGECFVVDFEQARLRRDGREALADRVEHVAKTVGDGEGFDVRSFERDGRDRLIEVKTTSFARETPFFVTRNEVEVSRARADLYHLYRVYAFRTDARLFTVSGAIDRTCRLDAALYRARIA